MDVYTIITRPVNGFLTGAPPNVVYNPNPGFVGVDSFTYSVTDDCRNCSSITVNIFVTAEAVTLPPSCTPVSASVQVNEEVEIALVGTDPKGIPLFFKVVTSPTSGSIDASTGALPATVTYTAPSNVGSDSFVFVASNGTFNSEPCEVSVTVTAAPVEPPTCDGFVTSGVPIGDSIAITLIGNDPGGLPLDFLVISGPSQGTLAESDPAQIRNYTANPAAVGSDTFTYRVRNSAGLLSDICTVTIPIAPPVGDVSNVTYTSSSGCSNSASVMFDLEFDTDFIIPSNAKILVDFSSHPGIDISSITTISPSGIDGSFVIAVNGSVLELTRTAGTPTLVGTNFVIGMSPLTTGNPGIYTLGLEIRSADDLEITGANVTSNTVQFSACVSVPSLNIGGFDYPQSQVSLTLAAPDAGCGSNHWSGTTTICSINGGSNLVDPAPAGCGFGIEGAVTETNPIFPQHVIDAFDATICPDDNIGPTADDQSVTTEEGDALVVTLTGSDPNSQPLTFVVVASPTDGVLTGVAPNITYTPNVAFIGADSFTFRVNDGFVNSSDATISINVTAFVPAVPPATLDLTKSLIVIAKEDGDSIAITL